MQRIGSAVPNTSKCEYNMWFNLNLCVSNIRALTMVRFVGKGHLNDQNPFFGQILVRHLAEKLAFLEFSFRYRMI